MNEPLFRRFVPGEAKNLIARTNAGLFVGQLYREMDQPEHDPNVLAPTPQKILERYWEVRGRWGSSDDSLFSLSDARGAADRNLRDLRKLAIKNWTDCRETNSILIENMSRMYTLWIAIEQAWLKDQCLPPLRDK
ncbi:hypothetical protein HQ584_07285 [Patescibacteria group bacterium]|nr:hypothetical protein [Patescibacteria group bacterium]